MGIGSGDGGVDEQFGCDEVCCGHASVAGISDPVAADCKACAMGLVFLRAIVATNATTGCTFVARHMSLAMKKQVLVPFMLQIP